MRTKAECIDVSYDEALKIAHPLLRKKIQHSVELIRKAEKIALMYDPEEGFYNTFSGGKDSQALFHIVKMAGVKFKTHMSLTSVDPADVIRFVKTEYPSIVRHKPDTSIFQKAIERQILPTMRVRWCCADFKESAGAGKVTLIGIRAEESARRARRNEVEVSGKKFSGNLIEFEDWSKSEIERKQKKTKRKLNEDEFSVKSDNEVRCINGKDSILISPIFDWTEKDIWYFLNNVIKAPHCSLYDEGYTRIGCILCPMSTTKSKQRDIKRFPHVKRNWIEAIKSIRMGGGDLSGGTSPQDGRREHCYKDGNSIQKLNFYQKSRWIPNTPPNNQRSMGKSRESGGMFSRENSSIRHGSNTKATGFSDSPTSGGVDVGQYTEDEIAEAIFDWWISGKSYKQWYAEKYLQQKIDFDFNDETTTSEEDTMVEQG